MPVPSSITDLSTTAASNSPAGSDNVFPDNDNHIRALAAFLASIRDNTGNGWVSPYWALTAGTPTISATAVTWSGNPTHSGNHAFSGNVTVSGNATVNGNTALGNGGADTVTTTGNVTLGIPTTGAVLTANGVTGAARLAVWNGSYSEYQLATVAFGYIGDRAGVIGSGSGMTLRSEGALYFATNGATERMQLTTDGRLFGTALHNNAGAITGTLNQYIASGTYTPTITDVSNTNYTAGVSQWIRVGNVVTVSGTHSGNTPVATLGQFRQSLPIASNLSAKSNLGGAFGTHNGFECGPIVGDTTNDAAFFEWQSSNTGTFDLGYTFTYVVL